MFRVNLKPGIHFKLNEQIYRILRLTHHQGVEVQDIRFGDIKIFTNEELIKHLDSGALTFEATGNNYDADPDTNIRFNSALDKSGDKNKHFETAMFRYKVIEPLIKLKKYRYTDIQARAEEINAYASNPERHKEAAKAFPYIQKVSAISVYRWLTAYEANKDNLALVPSHYRKGGANTPRVNDTVLDIIHDVIDNLYKTRQQLPVTQIQVIIDHRISQEQERLGKEIKRPTYPTICRIINQIPEAELVLTRRGRKEHKDKFGYVGAGVKATYPLERVEIDHAVLNVIIVDDIDLRPINRPVITAAIDKYSRLLLGFYVSFENCSTVSVLQCLRHVLMDKSYVKERYPEVQNEWPAYGLPKTIVVDNGPEFHSDAFIQSCFNLGITVDYAPVKTPEWKGSIERYFKTLNTGLIHNMPGTTRSNPSELGDMDPIKDARIPMSVFMEVLHMWVIDVYSQRKHRGTNMVPVKAWNEGTKLFPPAWPNSTNELPILIGMSAKRSVRAKGVELHRLYYNSPELHSFFCKFSNANKGYKEKFEIRFDPIDISVCFVYDHLFDKRWIKVPAVNQQYTKNLSLFQHKIILKISEEKFGCTDIESLIKTQYRILEKLHHWNELSYRERGKAAKFKGISSAQEIDSPNQDLLELVDAVENTGTGVSSVGMKIENSSALNDIKTDSSIRETPPKKNRIKKKNKKQKAPVVEEKPVLVDRSRFSAYLDSDY
ncbi:Mu transposase C-terminal domain-containing protein [Dethiobacter alkaliphilus]|uniref:Mu transposase C-terminal domain-containing protein n=1 Tax=Dethiobacter alkaliphilus TaxID=427926 RepID=UPI002226422E|nr:Mu transposase C-terminal domain-containing protein [Dethiobacter alkaliphilus]MCW3491343.1 DDE-type integrase/transposase/recombinase [Dethiobacter alkaliphilus]